MTIRWLRIPLAVASILVAGCAGYRGGWESVASLDNTPLANSTSNSTANQSHTPQELELPRLKLQVSLDNQLRTYDIQVYFYVLPLSIDPRKVYPKNVERGKTRVFLSTTPETADFIFHPSAAVLQLGEQRFNGAAGFEFGRWDENGKRVEQGGLWDHRPITSEFTLAEIGRSYYLSIDFDTPVPSPKSQNIVLDLSKALKSNSGPPLPLIRFIPARWKGSYS